jgi:predicted ATPase
VEILRKNNYFVLAGTSGTGKTTVLNHLNSFGYPCSEEAARLVLSKELAEDGPALPSKNPYLFIQSMMDASVKNFTELEMTAGPCFFDRGIPDLIHYATRFSVDPTLFEDASRKYRYNQKVFLFTPWQEIFINDNERRMTFEKSVEFHDLLVKVYQHCDYSVIEVPHLAFEARAQFILQSVNH